MHHCALKCKCIIKIWFLITCKLHNVFYFSHCHNPHIPQLVNHGSSLKNTNPSTRCGFQSLLPCQDYWRITIPACSPSLGHSYTRWPLWPPPSPPPPTGMWARSSFKSSRSTRLSAPSHLGIPDSHSFFVMICLSLSCLSVDQALRQGKGRVWLGICLLSLLPSLWEPHHNPSWPRSWVKYQTFFIEIFFIFVSKIISSWDRIFQMFNTSPQEFDAQSYASTSG